MASHSIDHRELAQQLDLLHFQEEAPGMVFWHPRGFALYRVLEEAVRRQARSQGYAEVRTPQILRRPVWEASGHWTHFNQGMFHVSDQACEAAVKPVSCPGHISVVKRRPPSYRELPLRLCELGVVHRDEPSGTLHGLLRLRQFTQDDGHVFCTPEQAEDEVLRFCRAVRPFYAAFGFDRVHVALSTRPAERAGSEADWDRAEAALSSVLQELDEPYALQAGGGAFYGPKLEFLLEDRAGRTWQCGTIQFDLVMPVRSDLRYIDACGKRRHPVMLHRALYGSLERFLGIVLEHYGSALPAWLSPEQAAVLPVAPEQAAFARALCGELIEAGIRARTDEQDSLSRRIARAHERGASFILLAGARELERGEVTVRGRDGQRVLPAGAVIAELAASCRMPDFSIGARP